MKILDWLEDFIQRANIMPIVALITIPHVYAVLSGHSEGWYVPATVSIFTDILHYRAVLSISYRKKWYSWLFAIVTTIATFLFQWNFYHEELNVVNRLLFSSIVPVGMVIMVFLESEKTLTKAKDIAERKIKQYTSKAMKAYEIKEQAVARLTQENESILKRLECLVQEMASLESSMKGKDSEIEKLKCRLKDAKVIMKAYNNLNPLVQDIAKSKAGILQVTQAELASKYDTNETHVSRLAKHVNGVQS